MNTRRKRKIKIGGKVLASGGYGCAFSPELKCVGSKTRTRRHDRISKLMTRRHALDEYEEIRKIKENVQDIPNYGKYFLVDDMNVCQPANLTTKDLENYEKKCKALSREKITPSNINESLDKLLSLNMANGGIPVDEFIKQSPDKWILLNRSLIELLNNGIVPLNGRNMYHCDVKDSNVLVDTGMNTRLIDWGLFNELKNTVPPSIIDRSFQFNVPFSNVLISAHLRDKMDEFKGDAGEYIDYILEKRGKGHYEYINEIMRVLYGDKTMTIPEVKRRFTHSKLSEYLKNVIVHGLKGDLSIRSIKRYIVDVYMPSIDIWGFVMLYFPMMYTLFEKNKTDAEIAIFEHLKSIFEKHLLIVYDRPISAEELTRDLNSLEELLQRVIPSTNKKSWGIV